MRAVIGLIVIVYLVGVGVVLAPTVSGKWSTSTAADLSASIMKALPSALAWPADAYRNLTGRSAAPTGDTQTKTP